MKRNMTTNKKTLKNATLNSEIILRRHMSDDPDDCYVQSELVNYGKKSPADLCNAIDSFIRANAAKTNHAHCCSQCNDNCICGDNYSCSRCICNSFADEITINGGSLLFLTPDGSNSMVLYNNSNLSMSFLLGLLDSLRQSIHLEI